MSIIEVSIHYNGEHWHKRVSVFGIPLYHRHDFAKDAEKKCVGFNVYHPTNLVEVEDEDYYPEECKRKDKKL